jgi:hypothetical protein
MAFKIKGHGRAPEGIMLDAKGEYLELKRIVTGWPMHETHYVNLGQDITSRELELARSSLYTYSKRKGFKVRTSCEQAEVKTEDWDEGDYILFITKMERE